MRCIRRSCNVFPPSISSRVDFCLSRIVGVWHGSCIFDCCESNLVGLADVFTLEARSSVKPDDAVMHLLPIFVSLCVIADDGSISVCWFRISNVVGMESIVSLLLSEEASVVSDYMAVRASIICRVAVVGCFGTTRSMCGLNNE